MRVPVASIGEVGLIKDILPQELADNAAREASNIRFYEKSANRFEGDVKIFDTPTVTPYYVQPFATTSTRFICHAGLTKVFVDDGGTRTEITGTAPTGAIDDRWTGGTLNGVMVLNNGVDVPMFWGGDTGLNLASLTAWDANWRCGSLRPFKNYLVALDITKTATRYPHMVKWSSAADPGTVPSTWDEADPTNDAGEQDLAETSDVIIDSMPLGNSLIIYKERSMYSMTHIGGQYIWQFGRLPGDVGAVSRGCIASTPVGHVVMTAGDVILHSGQGPRSIISGKVRRWLFNSINTTYYKRCFLATNMPRNEVWICYPATGQAVCTQALVWNWVENTFSIRDLANVSYACSGQTAITTAETWDSDSGTWDSDSSVWTQSDTPPSETRLILASTSPKILLADSGTTFDGTAFSSSVEYSGFSLGMPDHVKVVRAVYPRIDGVTGSTVYIQLGGTMDIECAYTWGPQIPYVIGSTYKADGFATGRFIGVRISSTASAAWRCSSFDFDVVQGGKY